MLSGPLLNPLLAKEGTKGRLNERGIMKLSQCLFASNVEKVRKERYTKNDIRSSPVKLFLKNSVVGFLLISFAWVSIDGNAVIRQDEGSLSRRAACCGSSACRCEQGCTSSSRREECSLQGRSDAGALPCWLTSSRCGGETQEIASVAAKVFRLPSAYSFQIFPHLFRYHAELQARRIPSPFANPLFHPPNVSS